MKRRAFLSAIGSGVAATAGSMITPAAFAASKEPIKLGLLFSQSGTMANNESLLKDISLMTIEQINAPDGHPNSSTCGHLNSPTLATAR